MATTRKSAARKPLTFKLEGSAADLPEMIEKISATPGTAQIAFVPNGSTLKAVTDRIRRIPRQRGLNALTVKATAESDGSFVLEVTNTGTTAVPWPKPAAKAAAKAPAKSTAKPAAKRTRKSTAKAAS